VSAKNKNTGATNTGAKGSVFSALDATTSDYAKFQVDVGGKGKTATRSALDAITLDNQNDNRNDTVPISCFKLINKAF